MLKILRLLVSLIPILLLSQVSLYAQYINYNITTGKNYSVLPFKMHNDFIVIPVKLDGKLPLNFILDSGASHTLLVHREFTDLLGTVYERQLYIQGADKSQLISALVTEKVILELPDITATNQNILVLEENVVEFEKYSGTRIDGILGMDIFKRFILKIDYESQNIYLFEPKHYPKNIDKYKQLKFISESGKMFFEDKIQIRNKNKTSKWLIDSGAAITAMIKYAESDTTSLPQGARPGNIGRGLGGYIEGYKGKVDSLHIGDYNFSNVVTNYQVLSDTIYQIPGTTDLEGLIGNKVLKQFHIIFDYHSKNIYLRPNKFYKKGIRSDLSGMSLIASGSYLNNYIVDEVYPNSPAEKAGIQIGDEIKKINGKLNFLITLQQMEKILSSHQGKKIKLKIKRGDKKLKLRLILRDYL